MDQFRAFSTYTFHYASLLFFAGAVLTTLYCISYFVTADKLNVDQWGWYQTLLKYGVSAVVVFASVFLYSLLRLHQLWKAGLKAGNTRVLHSRVFVFILKFLLLLSAPIFLALFLTNHLADHAIFLNAGAAVVMLVLLILYAHYNQSHRAEKSSYPRLLVSLVVLATSCGILYFASMYIETPWEAGEVAIDNSRIETLKEIEEDVVSYYTVHDALPSSIATLYSTSTYNLISNNNIEYLQHGEDPSSFTLCADFLQPTRGYPRHRGYTYTIYEEPGTDFEVPSHEWVHDAGYDCFPRRIEDGVAKPI